MRKAEVLAMIKTLNEAGIVGDDEAEILRLRVGNADVTPIVPPDLEEHELLILEAIRADDADDDQKAVARERLGDVLGELRSPVRVGAIRANIAILVAAREEVEAAVLTTQAE